MKNALCILGFFILFNVFSQENLTKTQWQEDLRFLQETVHKDYSFLFVKTTKEAFDTEVELLYKAIPELQEHEIIVGLSRIIALFKYGHTDISFRQKPFEFHYLPLNLYQYSDGIYIQGVHKEYANTLGTKVLEINGVPIAEALKRIAPVVNSENDHYFKAFGINYLGMTEVLHAQGITEKLQSAVELTLFKDDESFKQVFKAMPKGESVPRKYSHVLQDENWLDARDQASTPLYLKNLDKIYYFEHLPEEKAIYVRHSQIEDDSEENIPAFFNRVFNFIEKNDIEKLILDLRLNGGGNNYKNKSVITGIIETKKINQEGKLFAIIGRRTFSACQNLVNELDNYTNVTFVGEPTSENINFYGDARQVRLPNSQIPVYLSFAWWQDKPVWENADATVPNVGVELSFAQYVSNQDPVLDAVLNFSGTDFEPNPMRYITDLYMAGKMDELATKVPEMIQDPRYSFFDFEGELSKSAYNLLSNDQIEPAINIYSFVAQLFPDSPGAYKNLADAHLKVGSKDKAVELLKKAIALDPDGAIGNSAKVTLEKLR